MAYTQISWKNFVETYQKDISPLNDVQGDQLFMNSAPSSGSAENINEWLGFAEAVGRFDHYEPTIGLKVIVPSDVGQEYNYAIGLSTKEKSEISTYFDLDFALVFRLGPSPFAKAIKVDETQVSYGNQIHQDPNLDDLMNPSMWNVPSGGWVTYFDNWKFDASFETSKSLVHVPFILEKQKIYRLRYTITDFVGSEFSIKVSNKITSSEVFLDLFSGNSVEREVTFLVDGTTPYEFELEGIGSGNPGDYVVFSSFFLEEEIQEKVTTLDLGNSSGTFEFIKNFDNQWRLLYGGVDTLIDFSEIDALTYPFHVYAFSYENVYDGINDCGLNASLNTGGITDFMISGTSPSFGVPLRTKPEITIDFNYSFKLSTLPPAKNSIHLYDLDDNDAELTNFAIEILSQNSIKITFDEDLKLANSYQFIFDDDILNIWEMPLQNGVLNFLTTGEIDALGDIGIHYNTNPNDVYFKAKQLYRLLDVDQIFSELAQEFNFFYKPTDYDGNTKTYSVRETPISEIELQPGQTYEQAVADQYVIFDNKRAFEDMTIRQFMSEYETFFDSARNYAETHEDDQTTLESLKALLARNITSVNFFKGTNVELDFILSIFSRSIGYTLGSACPDPYNDFVYRVQSDMPKEEWLRNIKETSHPVSWRDRYFEIPKQFNEHIDAGVQTDYNWLILNIENIVISPVFNHIIAIQDDGEYREIGEIDDITQDDEGNVSIRINLIVDGVIDSALIPGVNIYTRPYDVVGSYSYSFDVVSVSPLNKLNTSTNAVTYVDVSYFTNDKNTSPYGEVRTVNESGNAMISDMLKASNFPFNHNKYDVSTYYNVLRGDLVNSVSEITQEQHGEHFQFYIRYGLANVSWKYNWEFWDRGTKQFEKTTNVPWIRVEDHDRKHTWSWQVRLRLEHGNWTNFSNWFYLNQFISPNFRRDTEENVQKFVDFICSEPTTLHNMLAHSSCTSHKKMKTVFDQTTIGSFDLTGMDVPGNFVIDNSGPTPILVFGDEAEMLGKFHSYSWTVNDVIGGNDVFTFNTSLPRLVFGFPTGSGESYTISISATNVLSGDTVVFSEQFTIS